MNTLSKRLLAFSFALFLVAGCIGCAKFWKAAPAVLDTAQCALANHEKPWPVIVAECGITKENEQAILDLVSAEKARIAAAQAQVGCR